MQLQNFSVSWYSGKWWAIKLKVTCLFRLLYLNSISVIKIVTRMFMSSSSDEFTFSEPTSKDGDGILAVPRIVARVSMFLVSAQSKRARSHVTCSPARQSWGTMVAVQWRIQGRGPGGPPPVIFRTKWGPKGGKNFFWDRPPTPSYLKVWIRRCSLITEVRSFCWFWPSYWFLQAQQTDPHHPPALK